MKRHLLPVLCIFIAITIVFGFLITTHILAANTYYVSLTGSDTNTPAQAQNPTTPWRSLNHAESAAATGDTINVAAGTYVENDPSTHGWNTAKGLNWVANGIVIVQGSTGTIRPLMVSGNSPATYTGFTIDAQDTYSTAVYLQANVANKTFTNCTFKSATSSLISTAGTASNITVNKSTFLQDAGNAITSGSNTNFAGLQVTNSTFTATAGLSVVRLGGYMDTITWQGNTSNLNGTIGYEWNITAPANLTISNNTDTVGGSAVWLNEASAINGSVTIQKNTIIQSSASSTISLSASSSWPAIIDSNAITSTNQTFNGNVIVIYNSTPLAITNNTIDTTSPNVNALINVQSSGTTMSSVQVKNNVLKNRNTNGNPQYTIIVGTDYPSAYNNLLNGAIITGNTIYGTLYYTPTMHLTDTHGIIYGFNANGVIENNTVYGQAYGVVVKGDGTTTYTSGGIFYNVFINNVGSSGIRVKGVNNVPVYNNTIYADPIYTGSYRAIAVTDDLNGQGSKGTVVKNNIFVGNGDSLFMVDSDSEVGLVSNDNLYYRPAGTTIGLMNYTTPSTFSQWQSLGYDTHSINANPNFNNTPVNDYSLQSSSPAIDSGTSVGLVSDLLNTPVPQGAGVDMGAYEYKNNAAVSTQGPILYYTFEEGVGSKNILNQIASGANATWYGTGIHYTNGHAGLGGSFNGVDDSASFPTASILNPSAGTVSLWINPAASQTKTVYAFSSPSGSTNSRIYFQIYNGGLTLICALGDGTNIGSYKLTVGVWTHIACEWNGASAALYVNGNNVTSRSIFNGMSNFASKAYLANLADAPSQQNFNGTIDNLRIYPYAQTQQQIQQDMAN